jgi:prepilin-type N-terminal cleavage/methylation domain-containing protein
VDHRVLAGASKMGLKKLKIKARRSRQRAGGFSLLEMMMVVAITIIVSLYAVLSLVPVMNQQRVNNAYNTTMAAMRLARDNAVSQRTSYSVTFSNSVTPNTIVVTPTLVFANVNGTNVDLPTATYQLPPGVTFLAQSQLASTPPPDGYGAGTAPIDFGYAAPASTGGPGDKTIYFCPDGSAENNNSAGNCSGMNYWSGGVVYLGRAAPDVLSQRALTLWGGTGRIHGWRLYSNGAGYQWMRQ